MNDERWGILLFHQGKRAVLMHPSDVSCPQVRDAQQPCQYFYSKKKILDQSTDMDLESGRVRYLPG